jgi:hypothetical protein
MKNPPAYFARPMSAYNTLQDCRDHMMIALLGYEIIEITDELTQRGAKKMGMEYFKPLVRKAHVLFFRSFPDRSIGAGVAKEIAWAEEISIPIFELPTHIRRRTLDPEDTRDMLCMCGER